MSVLSKYIKDVNEIYNLNIFAISLQYRNKEIRSMTF